MGLPFQQMAIQAEFAPKNYRALVYAFMGFLGMIAIVISSFYIVKFTTIAQNYVVDKYNSTYSWALSKLPANEKFLIPSSISIEKTLDMVSDEKKFDRAVLRAMALTESGNYTDSNRVKEEPQLLEPYKDRNGKLRPPRIVPPSGLNKIEKLLWASSHGVLQVVFGFHYKTCGLPENGWDQLHIPLINARCAATVLKNFADAYRTTIKDPSKRLWAALRDYNNSDEYADKVMRIITQLKGASYGEGL